jgi:hypothetical protein
MRWSKVRKLVEDSFAPSLAGRVRLFSTHYSCSCGYGSIVADDQQVAEFNTFLNDAGHRYVRKEAHPEQVERTMLPIGDAERRRHPISVPREFTRFDLHRACWQLLHMNPHSALNGDDPLLVALAALHRKVGVSRLRPMLGEEIHPLVRWAIDFRLDAERSAKRLLETAG